MQLDLFSSMSPTRKDIDGARGAQSPRVVPAKIFAFPTDRRRALVISTAQHLASLSKTAGRKFWSNHIRDLRRSRCAEGLSDANVNNDLAAYTAAVGREINLRTTYRMGPDHAA